MKIRVKEGETYSGTSPLTPLHQVESGVTEQFFELEANSHLDLVRISFGEDDFKQSFEVVFLGEGASCNLQFLDLAKNSRKLETIIKVKHNVPNCKSVQVHKGLYSDNSRGIFKAFIEVAKHALGTDASQLHRSLLLSPSARVQAEPHLQIGADAVKCKHGISIGQLDEKALFYLKARGLDEQTAKRFLIQGFAKEILEAIEDEKSRQELEQQVFAWI
ncbi:MAG: SufD family Fe-S cluster assembly protein [Myxococcaceae bacterium]